MKKLLALVLALVMTLGLATVANAADFADQTEVDASKYAEAISVLTGMGVFKGYGEDNTFRPDAKITRAQVAAMIYRIYTGDVDDKQIVNYVNLGNFSDVKSTDWYAGYVGYCANAKFIKGYGDGTFQPNREISGYEALAMILRAVGYNKNNDFEGADYWVKVAEVAQQYGMLDNISADDLTGKAPRATIAQILFDAIQVPTVTYTQALGYNEYKTANLLTANNRNNSLGWINFRLTKTDNADDSWGRPAYRWYGEYSNTNAQEWMFNTPANAVNTVIVRNDAESYGTGDVNYAKFNYEPTKTYSVKVTECDIAHDVGQTSNERYTTYLNANLVNDARTVYANGLMIRPAQTVATIGAQGRTTEVYYNYDGAGSNRIVMIDTFLARVMSVSARTFDTNEHLRMPALLNLEVYSADQVAPVAADVTLYNASADYEYAVGDYLLINLKTNDADANVAAGFAAIADAEDTITTTHTGARANRTADNDLGTLGHGSAWVNAAATNGTPFDLRTANRTTAGKGTVTSYTNNINNVPVLSNIVGKADSFEGAQTVINRIDDTHTIGGKVYNDALEFHLNAADELTTVRMNWLTDQFGNLIGCQPISRNDYAVLESLIWIQGTPGHAEAVLRYFDGTTETKTVASIDGVNFIAFATGDTLARYWDTRANMNAGNAGTAAWDNQTPLIADAANVGFNADRFARVSTDSIANGIYNGLALYRVQTLDSGAVRLDGWNDGVDAATDRALAVNTTANLVDANEVLVQYWGGDEAGATAWTAIANRDRGTLDKTTSAILTTNNGVKGNPVVLLNSDTQFIVRTGSAAAGWTYTTYTGTASLPDMLPGTVEAFYTVNANGNVATRVYVRSFVAAQQVGAHMFLTDVARWTNVGTGNTTGPAIVDGVERNVTATWAFYNANILPNVGKLMHVTFNPATGLIADATVVNEANDLAARPAADGDADCDYLAQVTSGNAVGSLRVDGDTLVVNQAGGASTAAPIGGNIVGYRLTNATFVGTTKEAFLAMTPAQLNAKGIWVVFSAANANDAYRNATTVYVGTRLSTAAVLAGVTKDLVRTNPAAVVNGTATAGATNTLGGITANYHTYNSTMAVVVNSAAAAGTDAWMDYSTPSTGAMILTTATAPSVATVESASVDTGATAANVDPDRTGVNVLAASALAQGNALDTANAAGNQDELVTVLAEDGWTTVTYLVTASKAAAPAAFLLGGQIGANTFNAPANDQTTTLGDPATPMIGGTGDMTRTAAGQFVPVDAALKALWGTSTTATAAINAAANTMAGVLDTAGEFTSGAALTTNTPPRTVDNGTFTRNPGEGFTLTLNSFSTGATVRTGYGTTVEAALADMALGTGRGTTITVANTELSGGAAGSAAGFVVIRVEASDGSAVTWYALQINN